MSRDLTVVLVRHGQTAWSVSGQHTGTTDIALTETGVEQARALSGLLSRFIFAEVLTSPASRAIETCALAGLGSQAEVFEDLHEWDYGEYEGLTSAQIWETNPGWRVFDNGAPGGESPRDVEARADRVLDRIRGTVGTVVLFAHGHILRVIGARWLGLPSESGRYLGLSTASVSELGFEHDQPVINLWNSTSHL